MALQRTMSGKVDKRTTEYKQMLKRMAKARRAAAKSTKSVHKKVKRTSDGTIDKRTKEGKAVCARMAKARRAKGSITNRLKRLFR